MKRLNRSRLTRVATVHARQPGGAAGRFGEAQIKGQFCKPFCKPDVPGQAETEET